MSNRTRRSSGRRRGIAAATVLGTVAATAGVLPVEQAAPAFAASTCSSTVESWHAGWSSGPSASNLTGVSSEIRVEYGNYCVGTANNLWAGFSMLYPIGNPGYAQSGYSQRKTCFPGHPTCNTAVPQQWAEDDNGLTGAFNLFDEYFGAQPVPGTSYKYTAVYNNTDHALEMYIGSSRVLVSSFDPNVVANWGTTGSGTLRRGAEYNGEVYNWGDDMIGSAGAHAEFGSLAERDSTQNWHTSDINAFGSPWFTNLLPLGGVNPNPQWMQTGRPFGTSCVNGPYCFGVWDSSDGS